MMSPVDRRLSLESCGKGSYKGYFHSHFHNLFSVLMEWFCVRFFLGLLAHDIHKR